MRFIRLIGILRVDQRFVQGYGRIAKALTNLLKKSGFKFKEEAQRTIKALKKAIVIVLVLVMFDFLRN